MKARTALPSRRVALASLAGFGAALALPKIGRAAALSPDAALIAMAQKVADLAKAEWAACARIEHEDRTSPRYRVTMRQHDRAQRRLDEAVVRFVGMRPVTQQGVLSKTAAVVAICDTYKDSVHPEWLTELTEATLRDVLAIGGAA